LVLIELVDDDSRKLKNGSVTLGRPGAQDRTVGMSLSGEQDHEIGWWSCSGIQMSSPIEQVQIDCLEAFICFLDLQVTNAHNYSDWKSFFPLKKLRKS